MLCAMISTFLAAALAGCAHLPSAGAPVAPHDHTLQLDQLAIHSDLPLPPHHRLLQDLAALRTDVSQTLALPVSDEPIQIYLFHDADTYHTYLREQFPDFPARRAFFVESDTRLAVYAHWGDRIAEDLRHETAHGYLHAVVPDLPLWLDEGLAEYFEVARGHGGVNRPHVELLHHELSAGRWKPKMERLEALRDSAKMTQLDYAEAWLWVHWMLRGQTQNVLLAQDHLRSLITSPRRPAASGIRHSHHHEAESAHTTAEHEHEHQLSRTIFATIPDANNAVVRHLETLGAKDALDARRTADSQDAIDRTLNK